MCRRVHKSVSSWGSVCVGCLLSWSSSDLEHQENSPAPPPPATFPLLAPACWVLGRREQETREALGKWGQGHDVAPQSHPEGGRRADLCLQEPGVLATQLHFPQTQAWFRSHCLFTYMLVRKTARCQVLTQGCGHLWQPLAWPRPLFQVGCAGEWQRAVWQCLERVNKEVLKVRRGAGKAWPRHYT